LQNNDNRQNFFFLPWGIKMVADDCRFLVETLQVMQDISQGQKGRGHQKNPVNNISTTGKEPEILYKTVLRK